MSSKVRRVSAAAVLAAALGLPATALGQGGGLQRDLPQQGTPDQTASALTVEQRIAAANATANSRKNLCQRALPFYWEVGDVTGAKVSGSRGSTAVYTAQTPMSYASASKWLYAAYVLQIRQGQLTADDLKMLRLRSGYMNLKNCLATQTVAECQSYRGNGLCMAANDDKFYYNGGHLQAHAVSIGLGQWRNAQMAAELQSQLGSDVAISFEKPVIAGGAFGTPASYSLFLRKLLGRQLVLGSMLGSYPACTNPDTCPSAVYTPIAREESWSYSIGHWIEDDPVVGDGAFSSGGALGFYPWIDASKTYYGIVAKETFAGISMSTDCGRLIRKAWLTGVAQ